jgi:hypothetical protein
MWNKAQEDPGMLGESSMNMNAHEWGNKIISPTYLNSAHGQQSNLHY